MSDKFACTLSVAAAAQLQEIDMAPLAAAQCAAQLRESGRRWLAVPPLAGRAAGHRWLAARCGAPSRSLTALAASPANLGDAMPLATGLRCPKKIPIQPSLVEGDS